MTTAGGGIGGIDIGGGGGPDGNKCDGGGCYRKEKFYFFNPSNINIQSKEEVVDHLFQVVEEDQKMVAMLVETLAVVVVAVSEKDLVVVEVLIEEKLNEQNKKRINGFEYIYKFFQLEYEMHSNVDSRHREEKQTWDYFHVFVLLLFQILVHCL